MTILTAVTNVASEAGYTVDSAVLTSTETTTKQLLAMANRINQEMSYMYPWTKLYASASITLVANQATYAMPSAFSWYHYDSFWNSSTKWRLLGPMSPQEYASVRGYGVNTTAYQRFQISGITNSELLISPTPSAAESGQIIIFEYLADRSVKPRTWATSISYGANSYTFNNGNYYSTVLGGVTGVTAPTHTSGTVSDGIVSWAYYSGAYSTFLADTDLSIFNERTLELGMLERFAEIHGLTVVPRYLVAANEEYSRQLVGKVIYGGGQSRSDLFAKSGVAVFFWTKYSLER